MSICCNLVRTLSVFLLATYVAPQELNSTLYSTIFGVSVAFSNENVVFTCVARGSNHMGWSSDEYIGTGGRRLDFISTNIPGTNRTSGATRAELISASVDQFIISRLYISIESTIEFAEVRCENIGAGTMTSLPFELADNDVSVTCDKLSVCPGETVTCECATGSSNTLMWVTDGGRLVFASTDPLLTRRNITGSSTFGILTDTYDRNGIRVIASNITVTASMSGTNLLIRCENVDRSTSNTEIIPISQAENCLDPNETTPSPEVTEPTQSTSSDRTPAITALAIVCALIILLFVAAIAILIFAWIKITGLTKKIIEKDEKIGRLEGEIENLEKGMEEKDITIGILNSEKDMKDREIAELRDKNKELEKEKVKREAILRQLKKEKVEREAILRQLKEENGRKDAEISGLRANNKQLTQTIISINDKLKGDQTQNQEKDTKITNLKREIERLNGEKDTKVRYLEKEIKRLTAELEKQIQGKSATEIPEKKKERKKATKKGVHDDSSSKSATHTQQQFQFDSTTDSMPQRNGAGAGTPQRQL